MFEFRGKAFSLRLNLESSSLTAVSFDSWAAKAPKLAIDYTLKFIVFGKQNLQENTCAGICSTATKLTSS